jgi:uncharacterized protein
LVDHGLELLSEEHCLELLQAEQVGRVGVSFGALPAIFPVNYKMHGGDILFRTGEGVKRRAAFEGNVVGFEVDRIDPVNREGWSVMVVGFASLMTAPEIDALGPVDISPWAAGERTNLVRIHPELISGRRITTRM